MKNNIIVLVIPTYS